MMLNKEYVRISDLFEETTKRGQQLHAFANVIQDATLSMECKPQILHDVTWLLAELLKEQNKKMIELQLAHMGQIVDNDEES